MFYIEQGPVAYKDPWIIPFAERKKRLCLGEKRIAYYYEKPDNSTFRYRVYNMIQVIECIDGMSASFFYEDDAQSLYNILNVIDVLVICRTRYTADLNQLIFSAKVKGVKVLFDVDDLVFDVQYTDLLLDTLDQNLKHPQVWDFWFAYIGRMGAALKLCDGCITTNSYLARKIQEFSGLDVKVIPNFINQEQLAISDRIFDYKSENEFSRTDDINIGYFSGSPTHNKDFAIVSESIRDMMNADDRIKLRMAGYINVPDDLAAFSDRIDLHPFEDFINLQRIVAHSEINIVPLQDNIFTNCKSELKYFEASAVGTLTIASPTYTYNECIHHNENGFLSRDYEWTRVLEACVQAIDTGIYADMAKVAQKDTMEKFAWYRQDTLLENTFT